MSLAQGLPRDTKPQLQSLFSLLTQTAAPPPPPLVGFDGVGFRLSTGASVGAATGATGDGEASEGVGAVVGSLVASAGVGALVS